MNIRLLKPSEIECRIGTFKDGKGMSLLLYKDARVDMRILDEVFTPMGWERKHELIEGNLYCTVSIYNEKTGTWISKQDVGTESNTEKEKGQASDSFKRACVNWGIGRELYTSPFIWIPSSKGYTKYDKFSVKEIGYNNEREINYLVLNDSKGNIAFKFGNKVNASVNVKVNTNVKEIKPKELINEEQKKELFLKATGLNVNIVKEILYSFGFESSNEITKEEFENVLDSIEKSMQR